MKFKGILFIAGQASKKPPMGARGHRIKIPLSTAIKAIPTIIGKPLHCTNTLAHHDINGGAIGIIEDSGIAGNLVWISGTLIDNAPRIINIQACAETLGLSFDCGSAHITDLRAKIWNIENIKSFIGAAVLKQSNASFRENSLFWIED